MKWRRPSPLGGTRTSSSPEKVPNSASPRGTNRAAQSKALSSPPARGGNSSGHNSSRHRRRSARSRCSTTRRPRHDWRHCGRGRGSLSSAPRALPHVRARKRLPPQRQRHRRRRSLSASEAKETAAAGAAAGGIVAVVVDRDDSSGDDNRGFSRDIGVSEGRGNTIAETRF